MIALVQLAHLGYGRCVALVEGDHLYRLQSYRSVYALACAAIETRIPLGALIMEDRSTERFDYDPVYRGESDWRLLPAIDHPGEPARCLVSGTGLTHNASAASRQAMHETDETEITDSMRMYQWGLEGGRPAPGAVGVQPEWFYKGTGTALRGHNEPLTIPSYAKDGGEEPEIAGVYLIDPAGVPRRVGLTAGNEFSDHAMEKQNYLYLAPSKLRVCAIGPELVIDASFDDVAGTVRIERDGSTLWSRAIKTGEANMSHTRANLEHHHFKYALHRRPGDLHVHFFGADAFSFGEGVALQDGDIMEIHWNGFGRPLRNPVEIETGGETYVAVEPV